MISFTYPFVAFLIVPIIFISLYYIKPKGTRNILRIAIKILIIFIILLSVASPFTVIERQGMTGSAGITIIADKTESMRLFDGSVSDEVYQYLSNKTPTTIDSISGNRSAIGDSIVKNVKSGGSILLISDGNNNEGRSIHDAINFALSLNATVY